MSRWLKAILLLSLAITALGAVLGFAGLWFVGLDKKTQDLAENVGAALGVLLLIGFIAHAWRDARKRKQGFWHVFLYHHVRFFPYIARFDRRQSRAALKPAAAAAVPARPRAVESDSAEQP